MNMARGVYRLRNIKSRGALIVMTDCMCKKKLEIYEAPCSLYALKNMIRDAVRRLWVKVSILTSLRHSLYSVDLRRLSTGLNA